MSSQRRRIGVLASSQLVAGVGVAAGLSVGGLLAEQITGTAALAGLVQTSVVLGAALAAVPLARLAGRSGRRISLVLGFSIASVGAALAAASAVLNSFPLLLLAALLTGTGTASGLQARFAATDDVRPSRRGLALSVVVWAAAIGAIAGPNLIGPGARLGEALGVPGLGGPWLVAVLALALGALIIAVALPRSPTLVGETARAAKRSIVQTLRGSIAVPDGRLGLVAIAVGHAVMVGIMAMTSVHLHGHGSTLTFIGIVISIHIGGMYAFAPVFGWATDRFSAAVVVALGATLLLLGAVLAAWSGFTDSGMDGMHGAHGKAETLATVGLFLIGLGWSAVTIAAATLIAKVSHGGEFSPTDVQGTADFTMGMAGALAGVLSGVVLAWAGYEGLSIAGAALLIPLIVELVRYRAARPRISEGADGIR